jgi:hypothetical protein
MMDDGWWMMGHFRFSILDFRLAAQRERVLRTRLRFVFGAAGEEEEDSDGDEEG